MNGNTISIGQIIWKVMRSKIITDLTLEEASEFAIEALRLIGAPLLFENKVTRPPIEVIEHKAGLPNDIINIRGIKLLQDDYVHNNEVLTEDVALRYATDLYHQDINCKEQNQDIRQSEFTYEIQNGVITTSFEKGKLIISYKGLMLDKDGFPTIPDDENVKFAIEYYIRFRYLEPLWEMGKVTDRVFQYIDQKKCWYMGAAGASIQMPNIDQLESTMNTVNRIIYNSNAHSNFYERAGQKERIRKYH